MNTLEELTSIIKEASSTIVDERITLSTNLIDDLGMDSIQIIEVIVSVELKFDIELYDFDMNLSNIIIVGELCNLIEKKRKEKKCDN